MERPDIAQFTTSDFILWREAGALEITPKFQRREVWKTPARSYFIDSILRNMPVPPILIRIAQSKDRSRAVREIIDGQQRLRALLDYVEGKYALTRTLANPNAGRRFSELGVEDQTQIRNYSFVCEIFKNIADAEVLEVFARVNTYSVGLNAQELRNGRYFGLFKQSAYALAHEHLEFWRRHRIFTETGIARMLEVELTSELIIVGLAGQQDKKKSIDRFYADNDEQFAERPSAEARFRTAIDAINGSVGDTLAETEFHRPPLFYTLFAVVLHRLFGVPGETLPTATKSSLNQQESRSLSEAVWRLSDLIVAAKQDEQIAASDSPFVAACQRQTDNLGPRRRRFDRLYREAFL